MKFIAHDKINSSFEALYLATGKTLRYLGHIDMDLKSTLLRQSDDAFVTNDSKIIRQGKVRVLENILDVVKEITVFV